MTGPDETTLSQAVQAAQAADREYARLPLSQREWRSWQRVPDRQVLRLLVAAPPLIAAAERDRCRAQLEAHFLDEANACMQLAGAHDEAADTRGGPGSYEIGCEMAFREAARYVADLLDGAS